MKIKFSKNELPYLQDFGMHKVIPTHVLFQTEKDMNKSEYFLRLTANGYGFGVKGQPPGNYGNGAISVSKNDLLINRHQWQIVEEEKKEIPVIIENASARKYCPFCNTGKLHRHIVAVDKGIVNYIQSLGKFKDLPLDIKETKTFGEIQKLVKAMFEDGDNYVVNYATKLKSILEKATKKNTLSDKLDKLKKFSLNTYQQMKLKEQLEKRKPMALILEKEREQVMRCEALFEEAIKVFLRRFSATVAEIPPPYDLVKEIFGEEYIRENAKPSQ